jgi:protein-S-isoprenylcysteine O-methyltransferase Ste14
MRLRTRGGENRIEWTLAAVAVCVGLGVGIAFLALYRHAAPIGGGWVVFGLGELVLLAGLGLRYWAVLTLGRFFKVTVSIQAEHRVVRSGPYRLLRHPSYTGVLLILLGLGVVLGTWVGLAALIVLPLLGILIRIRVEERVLLAALGDEYASYAADTRRLVPGVW